jgi:predicted ATPase
MARLDRLPAGKVIAQAAAVIGREFSYTLLSAVAPLPTEEMDRALQSLVESGLTSARKTEAGLVYLFKHGLLQDIARDSMLRSARRELNARVARALAERFPEVAKNHPELLAHHYTEAAIWEQAVEYWKRAGDLAAQRSANIEAINQLEKGLLLAHSLPDDPTRKRQELELLAILGRVMVAAKGYASLEVQQTFARARELFPHVADSTHKFVVLRGECQLLMVQARYREAHERAEELLRLANEESNSGYLLDAHLMIGLAHLYRGSVDLARKHLESCAELYDPVQHLPHAVRQGVDIASAVLAYLARALWIQGHPDLALERSLAAVELARTPSIPLGLAQASGMLALMHHVRGDLIATKEWVEKTLHYAREQRQPYWVALGEILDSWLRAHECNSPEAALEIARSIVRYKETGARLGMSWSMLLLAEAYQQAGQYDHGLQALAEALEHIKETGETYYAAEAHRRRGELLLAHSRDLLEAEACFLRALAIAREQHARAWELRAAISLARLWSSQGRASDAHQLLEGIYLKFAQGHDTADLKEAAELLSTFGPTQPGQVQALVD